ncbi:MAG TPA: hypothetical protein VK533_09715 [Sphingomonas sp.]|uniref:hypothetical protein n=1 Tax=Sphingomonas sp. TaxID=28214 RepID=UPI002CE1C210|nr:hypothetical protein [Sphingomonas sp.]HMI19810.1 hypothetical protein [Sphingomonas sp.]
MRLIGLLVIALLAGPVAADQPTDAFSRTVAGLRNGSAAATAHDRARLGAAVRLLEASGAHPMDGDDDLVKSWRARVGVAPAPAYRDRALGPAYRHIVLARAATMHFEQTFLAGQRARIAVVPIRRAAARLQVEDDDGHRVCAAAATGGCDWVPVWTTRFRVDVVNTGTRDAEYIVVIQ